MIRQSNSNQGSIGSQQSICSAEEVNVESDGSEGAVFEEEEEEEDGIIEANDDDDEIESNRTRRYGNRLSGRSISLSDDAASSTGGEHHRNYSISTSPSTSHPQSPPKWLPDHVVPKCMNCESQFTAFRRRHHCRNCGKLEMRVLRFKKPLKFSKKLGIF